MNPVLLSMVLDGKITFEGHAERLPRVDGDPKQWVVKASGSRGRRTNIAKATYIRLHKEALERGLISKGETYSKAQLYDILKEGKQIEPM